MILIDSLKIASDLAKIQHTLHDIRDKQSIKYKDWVLSLFNMNSKEEDAAKITYLLLEVDKSLAQFLFDFSNKIHSNQELSTDDWDIIHKSLLTYRTHLLTKSVRCRCH